MKNLLKRLEEDSAAGQSLENIMRREQTMRETLRRLEEAALMARYVVTVVGGEVRVVNPDTGSMEVVGHGEVDNRKLSQLASARARSDFDEDDDLLAGYLHGKDLSKERIIRIDTPNIRIGLDGKVETTFMVTAAAELGAGEKAALGDYVMGQCSDGWGEGFEQQEFKIDSERYYVSTWSRRATVKVAKR